jgi:hypothetical protein
MSLFKSTPKKLTCIFYKESGRYVELSEMPGVGSLNDIAKHFGYSENQFYTFFNLSKTNSKITDIIFEKFSGNLIAVLTKTECNKLNDNMINEFLQNYSFDQEFDITKCIDTLETGIEDGNLSFSFLDTVMDLEKQEGNNVYLSKKWQLLLTFENDILISFSYADGIEKWARYFKNLNPALYSTYFKILSLYRGDDEIGKKRELNFQFDALASIPKSINNPYIPIHTQDGIINFVMLNVCHYDASITLEQFIDINYKRFNVINQSDDATILRLNNFIYQFSNSGDLTKITQL